MASEIWWHKFIVALSVDFERQGSVQNPLCLFLLKVKPHKMFMKWCISMKMEFQSGTSKEQ